MKSLFKDFNVNIEYSERVVVRELDFLFKLVQLLEASSPRVIGKT